MTTIEIENIGPIEEFRYDMPGPGLHVLRGHQGAGKTTILRTVQLAADGRTDVKPTKRDGTPRGEATVAGKTIRISKVVREEGDLTVDGLGDLDIASLHTPKFEQVATRDRHRIKALVRIAGVSADSSLFHPLVDGAERFAKLVDADAVKTDDLVEMAARIKRSFERHALAKESARDAALANARAQAVLYEGVDTTAPHDDAALRDALTAAVEQRTRIATQREEALRAIERSRAAAARLASMPPGPMSPDEAAKSVAAALATFEAAQDRVLALKRELEEARAAAAKAEAEHKAAMQLQASAESYATVKAQLEAEIAASAGIDCPDDDSLKAAQAAVVSAGAAVEAGAMVRAAIAARAKAEEYNNAASTSDRYAKRLRDAARDTQEVLSNAIARIPDCPLRVRMNDDGEARLVLATDRSEAEPFDDLSDGEKWPIIIRLAAARNRLIVLPQAAFGELAASTRAQLHALAVEHGCYILTASVDDGELRGEAWTAATEEPLAV